MVVDRPRLVVRGDDERGSMVVLEDSDDGDDDWKQIALTLRGENKAHSERIQKLEQDIAALKTSHAALIEAHHVLQTQHEETSRELTAAQADAPMMASPAVATIPSTGPQGRDALYWYQMCRTLQAQFVESRRELELKTEQFVVALAKKNSSSAVE
jgi:hypothetical protein